MRHYEEICSNSLRSGARRRDYVDRVIAGLVWCVVLAGCGSDDSTATERRSSGSDDEQIVDLYERWLAASSEGRYEEACSLQTENLAAEMAAIASEIAPDRPTCAVGLEAGVSLDPSGNEITDIKVMGDQATADVGPGLWHFAKESGEWRIDELD